MRRISACQPLSGGVFHEFSAHRRTVPRPSCSSFLGNRRHPESLAAPGLHQPLSFQIVVRPLHRNDAHPLPLARPRIEGNAAPPARSPVRIFALI